jgi:NADH-quinone oxidoreductase subunit A
VTDAQRIWIWVGLIAATGLGIVIASAILGPRRSHPSKLDPYECGKPLFQDARERFPVHFYLMALAFILFDIEMLFLLPWALIHRQLGPDALWEVLLFIGILGVGYLYIWKRRVIDWDP